MIGCRFLKRPCRNFVRLVESVTVALLKQEKVSNSTASQSFGIPLSVLDKLHSLVGLSNHTCWFLWNCLDKEKSCSTCLTNHISHAIYQMLFKLLLSLTFNMLDKLFLLWRIDVIIENFHSLEVPLCVLGEHWNSDLTSSAMSSRPLRRFLFVYGALWPSPS